MRAFFLKADPRTTTHGREVFETSSLGPSSNGQATNETFPEWSVHGRDEQARAGIFGNGSLVARAEMFLFFGPRWEGVCELRQRACRGRERGPSFEAEVEQKSRHIEGRKGRLWVKRDERNFREAK